MSINDNSFDFLNNLARKMGTTGALAAVGELQKVFVESNVSMDGAVEAIEEYRKNVAPIVDSVNIINSIYAPNLELVKTFENMNIKGIISGLQTSSAVMNAIAGLDFSEIANIMDALTQCNLADIFQNDFTVDNVEDLYESGEITQEDINEEITEIISEKHFFPKIEWDKIKKSKWFIAIKILVFIISCVCEPVIDEIKDKTLDVLGVTEFWKESGVYDLIESVLENRKESAVSEEEAKAGVDENRTGNITKQKRESLLNKIKEIRTFISSVPQDENTGNLLSYLSELEKEVNGKKYGLVFEEHREEIDEVLNIYTPVLTEEKGLFIDRGGEVNAIIEGDNLAALKLLEKTHKEAIDLIYIDPPYNTLSEGFVYSDNQIDKNDTFQHSKWSSLLYTRLKLSKKLLSKNGVIFISIDDNELYPLKLICDEIFGIDNYISTIVVVVKPEGRRYGAFAKTHEYILVYANDINLVQLNEIEVDGAKYRYRDEIGGFNLKGLRNRNVQAFNSSNRPNLRYPFYVDIEHPDEEGLCLVSTEPKDGYIEVWASTINDLESVWRWGKDTAAKRIDELTAYRGRDGEIRIFQKERKLTQTAKTVWDDKEFISQKGTKEVQMILGKGKFDFPKPLELISRIIKIGSGKRTTILDFFAGSGTTGHSVMKLNAEDGGNRKFILCTNNENNICRDVTYERIKRVIDAEGYNESLKYYKVEYIPTGERMYYEYTNELLNHIRELVELENGVNFTDSDKIAIALTEDEFNEFVADVEKVKKCQKLYMGYDILPDEEQEKKLRINDIEIHIVPEYYYSDLQEY